MSKPAIHTKAETEEALALLEAWCKGTPLEQQKVVAAIKVAVHLARLSIKNS